MASPISAYQAQLPIASTEVVGRESLPGGAPKTEGAGANFGEVLTSAIDRAHASEQSAEQAADAFARGDSNVGIHEVMIASEKANIAVRYAVTLKNRVLEAYRELMNTPL